ncbi:hypothetical protein AVEN_71678-1 [Araneus ventricosus]|uniref:Tc1-like transposase DDE domain-containing protein n=1 Tax=Araneus ventricosus TaxID=182803 RepID=A0A4Y2FAL5_ARAVE|nr:hypothetical protein AVEN_71678-1 [Araneus ventricosus]
MSIDDSDRDRCVSNLSYHLHPFHCALRQIWAIPVGQYDTLHVKSRTKWLQEHSSDFRHFHCPPKSPDLNIIEPIWVALQCAVQKRSPPPGTPMDLRTGL